MWFNRNRTHNIYCYRCDKLAIGTRGGWEVCEDHKLYYMGYIIPLVPLSNGSATTKKVHIDLKEYPPVDP